MVFAKWEFSYMKQTLIWPCTWVLKPDLC